MNKFSNTKFHEDPVRRCRDEDSSLPRCDAV